VQKYSLEGKNGCQLETFSENLVAVDCFTGKRKFALYFIPLDLLLSAVGESMIIQTCERQSCSVNPMFQQSEQN